MNEVSLMNYLREQGTFDEKNYDILRYSLEAHIYYFGDHFKRPFEGTTKPGIADQCKSLLRENFIRYKYFKNKKRSGPNVVSNAYFNFNDKLGTLGYNVLQPAWAIRRDTELLFSDYSFYNATRQLKDRIAYSSFKDLIGEGFKQEFQQYRKLLTEQYKAEDVKAIFVPNDVSLFENLSISIFKELKRPSFIFLHGLPGRYNIIDENRSDYLIVWGEKLRQYYIKAGFSPDKVLVSGHPFYPKPEKKVLRNDLSDVLVLAKVGVGIHHSAGKQLYDRGNEILYLTQVQHALQKLGVKKARLRLHPTANPNWFYKFLDSNFFIPDESPLQSSLNQSSLVIGPTSTVFLEALYNGVNYLLFEPTQDGVTVLNEQLVPPFDGSEPGVPVAYNTDELEYHIKSKSLTDREILYDYISAPFDINFLKEMI